MNNKTGEDLFWSMLDSSVGKFCLNSVVPSKLGGNCVLQELGEKEWDWCGSQSILGLVFNFDKLHSEIAYLKDKLVEDEARYQSAVTDLDFQKTISASLATELRIYKTRSSDVNWELMQSNEKLMNTLDKKDAIIQELQYKLHQQQQSHNVNSCI